MGFLPYYSLEYSLVFFSRCIWFAPEIFPLAPEICKDYLYLAVLLNSNLGGNYAFCLSLCEDR